MDRRRTSADPLRLMQYIVVDRRVRRAMKRLAVAIVVLAVVAACGATPGPAPSDLGPVSSLPLTNPDAMPTSTTVPTSTPLPTLIPRCARAGNAAFPGVVEARPDGWFTQTEIAALPRFPETSGQVYGPDGVTIPPEEGPGRLALFETFPASDSYFKSRIEQSRKRDGRPIPVTVCGEATQVWQDDSTGELVVGWTDRNKSDVLIANTADFSVQALVDSAERVSDCCG